jgi:hypothetical protein
MSRPVSAVIVLLAVGLGLVACKKEAPPESVPVSVSSQPTAAAPASATPTEAADAGAEGGTGDGGAPTPGAVPTLTGVQTPVKNQSVDACCAALSSAQSKETAARVAERRAAQICAGVAGRVKSGETSRAAGLALIRGSLAGAPTPPACR